MDADLLHQGECTGHSSSLLKRSLYSLNRFARGVRIGGSNLVTIVLDFVRTVKFTRLLAIPPTVTSTLPVVVFVGTDVTRVVALQLVTVAAVPLNVTVLVPCVGPKFVPVIATVVPGGPDAGLKPVIRRQQAKHAQLASSADVDFSVGHCWDCEPYCASGGLSEEFWSEL